MVDKSHKNLVNADPVICLNLVFLAVVLLLHHVNFTHDYLWEVSHRIINIYEYKIDKILQMFAVGGFLFLSGLKIAGSKSSDTAQSFIKRRLLRIYPLYLLAVIVSSFTSYPYLTGTFPISSNFLVHVLCLQSILPDLFQGNYHTIWFVNNLLSCYLLFLLLRDKLNHFLSFFTTLSIVLLSITALRTLAAIAGIKLFTGDFDTYLIFFSLGALYSRNQSNVSQLDSKPLLLVSTIALVGFFGVKNGLHNQEILQYLLERIFILSGMIPLYSVLIKELRKIKIPISIAKLMQKLFVASFCVFLFHRSFWSILATIWSQKSYIQSTFILGLGIPLIFVISYWIQVSYDRIFLAQLRPQIKR
jgi:peptidoglycan/LPS O-acetylase OafA/YrhL